MTSRGTRVAAQALPRSRETSQQTYNRPPMSSSSRRGGQTSGSYRRDSQDSVNSEPQSLSIALQELYTSVQWLMRSETQRTRNCDELAQLIVPPEIDTEGSESDEDTESNADSEEQDDGDDDEKQGKEEFRRKEGTIPLEDDTFEGLAERLLQDRDVTPTVATVFDYFKWFIDQQSRDATVFALRKFYDIFYTLVTSDISNSVINKERLEQRRATSSKNALERFGVPYFCLAQSFGSAALGLTRKLQQANKELEEMKGSKRDRENQLIQALDKVDYLEERVMQLQEEKETGHSTDKTSGEKVDGTVKAQHSAHASLVRKNMELEKQIAALRSSLGELYQEVVGSAYAEANTQEPSERRILYFSLQDVLRNMRGQSHRTGNRFALIEFKRRMNEDYITLTKSIKAILPMAKRRIDEGSEDVETLFDRPTAQEHKEDEEKLSELNQLVEKNGVGKTVEWDLQYALNDLLDQYDRATDKPLYQKTKWEKQNFATEFEELLVELRSIHVFCDSSDGIYSDVADPLFAKRSKKNIFEQSNSHHTHPWIKAPDVSSGNSLTKGGKIMYLEDGCGYYLPPSQDELKSVPKLVMKVLKQHGKKEEDVPTTVRLLWTKFEIWKCKIPIRHRVLGKEKSTAILAEIMSRKLSLERKELDLRYRNEVWSPMLKGSQNEGQQYRGDRITKILLGDFLYEYLLDRYVLKEACDSVACSLLFDLSTMKPNAYQGLVIHAFSGNLEECAWKYFEQCMQRLEKDGIKPDTHDLTKIVTTLYPAPFTPPVSRWISRFKAFCAEPSKPTENDLRIFLANQVLKAPETEPRIGRFLRSIVSLPYSITGFGNIASLIEILRRCVASPLPDHIERLLGPFMDAAVSTMEYTPTNGTQRMLKEMQNQQAKFKEQDDDSGPVMRDRRSNEAHIEQLAYIAATMDLVLFEWNESYEVSGSQV